MKIYEKAPAKINLLLDVLRKRDDGYHEVEMIMTMVDLADRLEMQELPRDTIMLTSQVGYIPLDEKNLAFQAARLIKERYGVSKGVYIHLDKKYRLPQALLAAVAMLQPPVGLTVCGVLAYQRTSYVFLVLNLVQMFLSV